MKRIIFYLLLLPASASAQLTLPPSGDNQKSNVGQWIGPVEVKITYSSPDVHAPGGHDRKGRIWGEVAHYGFKDLQGIAGTSKISPWRAGANENTVITFSHDVKVEGKDLKAGSYGLFLDVEKEGPWSWIFSKNYSSWGSFMYDSSEDALRVQIQPQEAAYTEYLTYSFDDRKGNSATAFLQWENKKVPFKIEIPQVNDLYVSILRNELRSTPALDYHNWVKAAQFCADNKVNLEEALTWAQRATNPVTGGTEDFSTLFTKSNVLNALGRSSEADATMERAVKLPSASMMAIHQYARGLLSAGKKEKALEIFRFNAKAHPEEKFVTYVGLARGLAAGGNNKEAIKNWEIALRNVPENQKANISNFEQEVKKLKEGK